MGIFSWIDSEDKRTRLAFLGAGAAALIGGLWTAFVYFNPPKPDAKPSESHVTASSGGVAIGGAVTNSNVTAGSAASEKK